MVVIFGHLVFRKGTVMQYAQIITEISIKSLEKVFTYAIPSDMQSQLTVGSVVEIPFGAGNRKLKGYVMGFTDSIDFDVSKIKYIERIYDQVGIESELLGLAIWMKQRYCCTLPTALKTLIPRKVDVKKKEDPYVQSLLDSDGLISMIESLSGDRRYESRTRALEYLMDSPFVKQKQLMEEASVSRSVLKTLEKNSVIEIIKEQVRRLPYDVDDFDVTSNLFLNSKQSEAVNAITESIENNENEVFLLHGITGSGKTEVYMQAIEKAITRGESAIVLIPEIGLTPQMVRRFVERFGDVVGVMHSRLSEGERFDQWQMARDGLLKIMIGPRSAAFAPFEHIGIIIIDEEHEMTYKSEMPPKYHAREVAIYRGHHHKCPVVLGSATPLVETYYKALDGKYRLLELPDKAEAAEALDVETVDMRMELSEGNKSILSESLRQAMAETLERKEQIILFLNRRGHSSFVSCRKCGYVLKCHRCDVSYSYHKFSNSLLCHYCGNHTHMVKKCPSCGSEHIRSFGIGTQKVEAFIQEVFPEARLLRMDYDTTSGKHGHQAVLDSFGAHEADILIGTQMVAKGHHFDNVTLVGVIAADMSLYINDFRASERTFQLITQVTGRSGRGSKKGRAIIQTYSPEHYSLQAAQNQDYISFYRNEIAFRQLMGYAPFGHMMTVLMTSKDEKYIIRLSYSIFDQLSPYEGKDMAELLGPSPASMSKIKDTYRRVIYVKSKNYKLLTTMADRLYDIMRNEDKRRIGAILIDINPMMGY